MTDGKTWAMLGYAHVEGAERNMLIPVKLYVCWVYKPSSERSPQGGDNCRPVLLSHTPLVIPSLSHNHCPALAACTPQPTSRTTVTHSAQPCAEDESVSLSPLCTDLSLHL